MSFENFNSQFSAPQEEDIGSKAPLKYMDTNTPDAEVFGSVARELEEENARIAQESREVETEAPVIEIAGKSIKVDAYTDTWRSKALSYRENPAPIDIQMEEVAYKLKLLTQQVQQVTERMEKLRQTNPENEIVLDAEYKAQIDEKLLAFQPFYEYEAIFNNAQETLDEVSKILTEAERQKSLESARNAISAGSNS